MTCNSSALNSELGSKGRVYFQDRENVVPAMNGLRTVWNCVFGYADHLASLVQEQQVQGNPGILHPEGSGGWPFIHKEHPSGTWERIPVHQSLRPQSRRVRYFDFEACSSPTSTQIDY